MKDSLEQHITDQCTDIKVQPPSKVWNRINTSLDSLPNPRTKPRLPNFYLSIISTLVVLAGMMFYGLYFQSEKHVSALPVGSMRMENITQPAPLKDDILEANTDERSHIVKQTRHKQTQNIESEYTPLDVVVEPRINDRKDRLNKIDGIKPLIHIKHSDSKMPEHDWFNTANDSIKRDRKLIASIGLSVQYFNLISGYNFAVSDRTNTYKSIGISVLLNVSDKVTIRTGIYFSEFYSIHYYMSQEFYDTSHQYKYYGDNIVQNNNYSSKFNWGTTGDNTTLSNETDVIKTYFDKAVEKFDTYYLHNVYEVPILYNYTLRKGRFNVDAYAGIINVLSTYAEDFEYDILTNEKKYSIGAMGGVSASYQLGQHFAIHIDPHIRTYTTLYKDDENQLRPTIYGFSTGIKYNF